MSAPITMTAQWATVMQRARYRCQCEGTCGRTHPTGRCPAEHDRRPAKNRPPVRLVAAPADPSADPLTATRLPANQLRAWCPTCHDSTARAARKATRTTDPQTDALFDVAPTTSVKEIRSHG